MEEEGWAMASHHVAQPIQLHIPHAVCFPLLPPLLLRLLGWRAAAAAAAKNAVQKAADPGLVGALHAQQVAGSMRCMRA